MGIEWFGYQYYGIKLDFVMMVKGVVFGYVVIVVMVMIEEVFNMFKDDVSDLMNYFCDILIFGGCIVGLVVVLENMCIIEDEGLLENCINMGVCLCGNFEVLMEKYVVIGDVCGKGFFMGVELVFDCEIKEFVLEVKVQVVIVECGVQGVIIGVINCLVSGCNNMFCFSFVLIVMVDDIDKIIEVVDVVLICVFD